MTDQKRPDDRELEQYLEGGSKLSRRYRDASSEASPPELDEAILARSRAELKRKPPSLNRYLAPVALAASLLLGVNLAWNLYQVEPVPVASQRLEKSAGDTYVPEPAQPETPAAAPPEAKRRVPAAPSPKLEDKLEDMRPSEAETDAATREREQLAAAQAKDQAEAEARSEERATVARQAYAEAQQRQLQSRDAAGAAAPSAALAPSQPAPLTEAQKIDRLIGYVAQLDDVAFIRNGKEHTAADAAKHMQLKRDKAGERCDTAEEFIRVCASFSSRSGEAYLMRFPDGRTRTAEDVLREQLAAMDSR